MRRRSDTFSPCPAMRGPLPGRRRSGGPWCLRCLEADLRKWLQWLPEPGEVLLAEAGFVTMAIEAEGHRLSIGRSVHDASGEIWPAGQRHRRVASLGTAGCTCRG